MSTVLVCDGELHDTDHPYILDFESDYEEVGPGEHRCSYCLKYESRAPREKTVFDHAVEDVWGEKVRTSLRSAPLVERLTTSQPLRSGDTIRFTRVVNIT